MCIAPQEVQTSQQRAKLETYARGRSTPAQVVLRASTPKNACALIFKIIIANPNPYLHRKGQRHSRKIKRDGANLDSSPAVWRSRPAGPENWAKRES
jgi:hypothetical protein